MNDRSDLLRITHRTVYRYAEPVTFQPHRLVMRPREGHDLRVERLTMNISPRCQLVWSRDVFGNSIAQAYFTEPADVLQIESNVTVRRFLPSTSPPLPSPATVPYPVQYDALEQAVVGGYVAPVFPEEGITLQTWLRTQQTAGAQDSAADFVMQLTAKVHAAIAYQRREEKGVQSPAATLTLGTGSCRDLATLLMESLRHLGLAARFASGYLDCAGTRAAHGVTHAWTEVYFPNLGWRGYDATTGEPCTHQHIVVGVSNHPRGVMPISGKFLGPWSAFLGMDVTVAFSEA